MLMTHLSNRIKRTCRKVTPDHIGLTIDIYRVRHQRAPEVNRYGPQSISSSCCQNFSSDVLFFVLIRVTSAPCHNGTPISASVKRLQEPSSRSAAKCQINKSRAIGKCAAWLYFSGSFIIHGRITPSPYAVIWYYKYAFYHCCHRIVLSDADCCVIDRRGW